jgi:hypothetical protein
MTNVSDRGMINRMEPRRPLAGLTALILAFAVAAPVAASPTKAGFDASGATAPAPAVQVEVTAAEEASPPAAVAKPYSMNVLRTGDFVSQTNNVQCVGASIQMMVNMVLPKNDRTAKTQATVQQLARQLSSRPGDPARRAGGERRGASVRGWARALPLLDAGPYVLRHESTLQGALRTAARAMRATGKPVGLLVWRGRHAWVMSGFKATADPALTNDFTVTSVSVADPWYPRVSSIWGRSPRPGTNLTVAQVGRSFLKVNRRWMTAGEEKWVIVQPYNSWPQPASLRLA